MTKVLLALIAMIGGVATPTIIWLLNKSRVKDNTRDAKIAGMETKLETHSEILVATAKEIGVPVPAKVVASALKPPPSPDAKPVSTDAKAVVAAIEDLKTTNG